MTKEEITISKRLDVRVNEQIRAKKVRLISIDGKQIGIVSIDKALLAARENDLDLVEVA
ncbi:MAG: translation initiation factor IF-3, partial [Desulfatiglandales bacterium]